MISEHEEVARFRVAERVRAAEEWALYHEGRTRVGPRRGLASALRRLADKLEPRHLTEPRPRHGGTGLSIIR